MSTLFLDTTYDVTVGVLEGTHRWLGFEKFQGKRASGTVQVETHRMLSGLGISLKDITAVVTVAGPGFYTGLRLSEGFADVLSFLGVPHYSFYSYEIPRQLGVKKGVWMTKAYRGEYFFFHWDGDHQEIVLVPTADLEAHVRTCEVIHIHSQASLDEKSAALVPHSLPTFELIQSHPEQCLGPVMAGKQKRESFYFRAPEDEFRTSQ